MSTDAAHFAQALAALLQRHGVRGRVFTPANFWDVVEYGSGSYENRYNRMLRWLLDPAESHGLGPSFANALLALPALGETVDVGTRGVRVRVEVPVQAEADSPAGRIDVVLTDRVSRLYVAVEAKMDSHQHSDQLRRYADYATTLAAPAPDWNHRFVFLTPTPEVPEHDAWVNVTYPDLWPALEAAVATSIERGNRHAQKIIEDFLHDQVRRLDTAHSEAVRELYYEDAELTTPRFATPIAALARLLGHLEDENGTDVPDALFRQIAADEALATLDAERFHSEVESALDREVPSLPSGALDRIVAYVWINRPRVLHDHAPSGDIQDLVSDIARFLVGRSIEPGEVATVRPAGAPFVAVKLSSKRQSVRLFVAGDDGPRPAVYLAGNNRGKFPAVLGHYPRPDGVVCHLTSAAALTAIAQRGAELGGGRATAPALVAALVWFLENYVEDGKRQITCSDCGELKAANRLRRGLR